MVSRRNRSGGLTSTSQAERAGIARSLRNKEVRRETMKRNGRTAWQIEEEIGKVVQAAFTRHGYRDDVAFEIRQETGERA